MYHPSRGAARRLGPCLRAYQARPQVKAEERREGRRGGGERPFSEPWGGARAGFRAGAVAPCRPYPTCTGWLVEEAGVAGMGKGLCPAGAGACRFCPESGQAWSTSRQPRATALRPRLFDYLCLEVI